MALTDDDLGAATELAEEPSIDPALLFDPGRVLSAYGPHGTVVRAAVADPLREEVGMRSVAVKILPITKSASSDLQNAVEPLRRARCPNLVRYVGVWPAPVNETWLVSELCESGSVVDILNHTDSNDIESVVGYVVQQCLQALDYLHKTLNVAHGDIRPRNILVGDDASIRLSDYGIYHVVSRAMANRQCYAGMPLWPAPEVSQKGYGHRADIWAVGVTVVDLIEGSASVLRTRRSGRRTPRLSDPSRWSMHLHDFIAQTAVIDARLRPSPSELLCHRFVAGATDTALRAALDRVQALPSRPEQQRIYDRDDIVANLYRGNNICMRVPLVDVDDIPIETYTLDHQKRHATERPAVEQTLWLASDTQKHLLDIGRVESKAALVKSSARIMQWLDISSRRLNL